jgi:hypothetical protein
LLENQNLAFKYDRFFRDIKNGDTLKVFQGGSNEGMHQFIPPLK